MLGRLDHFSIPFDFKKVGDQEARKTFQQIELILQRLAREASLSITSTLAATVLNDLADVTITAAANNDFLKYNGAQWVNFPLFTTANTWGATQNVQDLIPVTNDTFDLGSLSVFWQAIHLAGDFAVDGVDLIDFPTAVGSGLHSNYSMHLGGGSAGAAGTEGGTFYLYFDGIAGGDSASNELIIDLGAPGGAATSGNRLTIFAPGVGGFGDISFSVAMAVAGGGTLDWILDSTGGNVLGLGFLNSSASDTATRAIRFGFQTDGGTKVSYSTTENRIASVAGQQVSFANYFIPGGGVSIIAAAGNASSSYSYHWYRSTTSTGALPTFSIAGGRARFSQIQVDPPAVTLGASTIADAVSLYVSDEPGFGTARWAFWVAAGKTRIDGLLALGGTAGIRASAAAGVLTLLGQSGTNEDLTINLSAGNLITLASTTGVTDFILSFDNVRTTSALEIDGNLNHDGANIGFFGGGLAGQGAAYNQTAYSTADRTIAALTSSTLTDSTGGTANTTVANVPDPADAPVDADALREDFVANIMPVIRNNFADLTAQHNFLRDDLEDVKRALNAVIDDLQSWGMVG